MQLGLTPSLAEDMGGASSFYDAEGLHLHVWRGKSDAWNLAGSLSSHGTLAGLLAGYRCTPWVQPSPHCIADSVARLSLHLAVLFYQYDLSSLSCDAA